MHSLPLIDGFMPIQPFVELALLFSVLTLGAFCLEQHGYHLNKLFQAVIAFAIVYWYLKYRLYPPLPFTIFVTCLTVASLGIWGWVSSNDVYWREFCRPLIAVLDGNTVRVRVTRKMVVVVLPMLAAIWTYSVLLPPDPSANGPIELRTYNPAPPAEITVYSPDDFRR